MRTNFAAVCAALPLLVLICGRTFAADANTSLPGKTEIHLSQQAVRVLARDRLRATLRIDAKGNNGRQIQQDINKRIAAALESAKKSPSVVAETGSYSVHQNYNTKDANLWEGSQTLTVSSDDSDAVLNLVGDLQNAGMLMQEMQFFLAPETLTAAQDDLTAAALSALRARVDNVARDLNMEVDHYRLISIGNAEEQFDQFSNKRSSAQAVAGGKNRPPAVQAGDATVTLGVTADVVLVPRKTS